MSDYETAPEMLVRLGTDAMLWAQEFSKTAVKLGYSEMDEGWLIGWFANAIENCDVVRCNPIRADLAAVTEERDRMREALIDTTASLVAAVSLLERGGKKAAPSNTMFSQMLVDFKNSIDHARAAIEGVAPASPWRDIESAPKDRKVLVLGKMKDGTDYQEVSKYFHVQNCWPVIFMEGYLAPTHWMPLPEPPANTQTGER